MRLGPADLGCERKRDRFRQDQPLRRIQIAAHAVGVDVEPLGDVDNRVERAGCDEEEGGKGRPLRLPAAEPTFVLLHLAGDDGGGEIGRERGRRERGGCRRRIALVGHGG